MKLLNNIGKNKLFLNKFVTESGYSLFSFKFPKHYKNIEKLTKELTQISLEEQLITIQKDNEYFHVIINTDIDEYINDVEEHIYKFIEENESIIKKEELFKNSVNILRELFNTSELNDLENLNIEEKILKIHNLKSFSYDAENTDNKGNREVREGERKSEEDTKPK